MYATHFTVACPIHIILINGETLYRASLKTKSLFTYDAFIHSVDANRGKTCNMCRKACKVTIVSRALSLFPPDYFNLAILKTLVQKYFLTYYIEKRNNKNSSQPERYFNNGTTINIVAPMIISEFAKYHPL